MDLLPAARAPLRAPSRGPPLPVASALLVPPHSNATAGADDGPLSQLRSPDHAEEELLTLYLELKPERDHTALLGVDVDCKRAALDRAWEARLAQLDSRLVPSGPARPFLLARVEELRSKIDRAFRIHAARTPRDNAGAYVMLDRIGAGGMAEVFRGRSTEDDRIVAIKRIRPESKDDGDFARKLLEEARLARRVRHANVVRVFTAGKSGDDLYLAMEWVDGADLHGLLTEARRRGQWVPAPVACRIVADASGGLHAAHCSRDGRGKLAPILHCDVSTSNILVSVRGEVKLTDFGIARALGQPSATDGEAGLVRGKLPYLAPELLEGVAPSIHSDIYAMGMTLYAALCRLPFLRRGDLETMVAVVRETLPRPSSLRPDLPPALDAILLRACARDPRQRFDSAQELQIALEGWLARQGPVDLAAWVRDVMVPVAGEALSGSEGERTLSVHGAPATDPLRSMP